MRFVRQTTQGNQFSFNSSVQILQIVFVIVVAKCVGLRGAM